MTDQDPTRVSSHYWILRVVLLCVLLGNFEALADPHQGEDYASGEHNHALPFAADRSSRDETDDNDDECFHCCHIHLSTFGSLYLDVAEIDSVPCTTDSHNEPLLRFFAPPTPPPTA